MFFKHVVLRLDRRSVNQTARAHARKGGRPICAARQVRLEAMAPPDTIQPKLTYKAVAKLEPFFTGGVAARATRDNKHLACSCGDEVKVRFLCRLRCAWRARLLPQRDSFSPSNHHARRSWTSRPAPSRGRCPG